jgi:hypothetical protein
MHLPSPRADGRVILGFLPEFLANTRATGCVLVACPWASRDKSDLSNIARWIFSTIQLAYSLATTSSDLRRQASVTAHELRALSASWAAHKGVALGDVFQSSMWGSHSTFSQFYLRDCSVLVDGMRSVGPVVAAQLME